MQNQNTVLLHRQIGSAFCTAAAFDDASRSRYLSTLEPAVKERVEELLAAQADAGSGFLSLPQSGPDATGTPDIPGYSILQQIGEGGMGRVFLAEQAPPLRRQVAIKIIGCSSAGSALLNRFHEEQSSNALFHHENIARVFDAGVTSDHVPYMVMEYVEGLPITRFCDEHEYSIPQRLGLFLQICDAIQHAHQKGIIHRDVKPSNVLVTSHHGSPVVKVIDFGLAKVVTADKALRPAEKSLEGQVVGTIRYMSPEQTGTGDSDADTRSDVYSLGVLLFELLTSTTPITEQRATASSTEALLHAVRSEAISPPSVRVASIRDQSVGTNRNTSLAALKIGLKPELDWIVLKALRKSRAHRYASVSELANDIQRHLRNEVVEATPPSRAYRLRKFVWKNRFAVSVCSLITSLLLVAAIVSSTFALWFAATTRQAKINEAAAIRSRESLRIALQETREREHELASSLMLGFSVVEERYLHDEEPLVAIVNSARQLDESGVDHGRAEARSNLFRAIFPLLRIRPGTTADIRSRISTFGEAKALLDRAIAGDPKLGLAFLARAHLCAELYHASGPFSFLLDREQIAADWNSAVHLMPRSSYAYTGRGWWNHGIGNLEAAHDDLRKAVRLNPKNDFAWQGLGIVQESRGEYAQSVEAYLRAYRSTNPMGEILFGPELRAEIRDRVADVTADHLLDNHAPAYSQIYPAALARVFCKGSEHVDNTSCRIWQNVLKCLNDESVNRDELLETLEKIVLPEGDAAFHATLDLMRAAAAASCEGGGMVKTLQYCDRSLPIDATCWIGELSDQQLALLRNTVLKDESQQARLVANLITRIEMTRKASTPEP